MPYKTCKRKSNENTGRIAILIEPEIRAQTESDVSSSSPGAVHTSGQVITWRCTVTGLDVSTEKSGQELPPFSSVNGRPWKTGQ